MGTRALIVAAALPLVLAGCAGDDSPAPGIDGGVPPEAGADTGVLPDTGADGGFADGAAADTGAPVLGAIDGGPKDAETEDGGPPDASRDAGFADASRDAGFADASHDGGSSDAAPSDSGVPDAAPDAGSSDAAHDGGYPDAAPADAGLQDAGASDTGVPDAGPDAGFCATPSPQYPRGIYELQAVETICGATPPTCQTQCTTRTVRAVALIESFSSSRYIDYGALGIYLDEVRRSVTNGIMALAYNSVTDCLFGTPSIGFGDVEIDLATGEISGTLECAENYPGPCVGPPAIDYEVRFTGRIRCQRNASVCVDSTVITCDTRGTVTSSVACNAPCAP